MALDPTTFQELCRARALLGADGSEFSVREIARQVGISPFHFIRQFRSLFGVTPHQYRIRARMEHAKRLLAGGGHSVTDICMDVGMSSLGSFSETYSRRTGAAPSDFKANARNVPQSEIFPGCLTLMASLPVDAFSNFREAGKAACPLECEKHENQADKHHG